MADKRTTPEPPQGAPQSSSEGPQRKKRAAPTIDLTATEVPPQEAAPPDPPPAAAESPPHPTDTAPADTAATPTAGSYGKATLVGGGAGLAAALLVMLGFWLAGLMPPQPGASSSPHVPIAADSKAFDTLSQRVNALEAEIKKLPTGDAGLTGRLAAAENAMKSLGVALTALSHRSDDIATNVSQARDRADAAAKAVAELRASVQDTAKNSSAGIAPAELDALQKRIATLEQSATAARDDIAKASSADAPARLVLSAVTLDDVIRSGAPFAVELAQAKSLGADDKWLDALALFAGSGVPTDKMLANELSALIPAMVKISGASAPQGGFFERLQANAGSLVRISPVDAPPGDDVAAVLARIEIAAAKADIPAALADLKKLPDATRAPAKGWIEKANKRQAALAAARQLINETARALGPKARAQ